MRLLTYLLVAGLLAGSAVGCRQTPPRRDPMVADMFAPTAMRIHPIFTGIRDWTGDSRVDGIEALIEFQDQFGDPTKAAGRVIFELFEFRRAEPDPRGERVVSPWIGAIESLEQQRLHWNRTSRTYSFQLAWPQIQHNRRYVLTAVFEQTGGGRFFSRTILEPVAPPPVRDAAAQDD